ncbi:hypothetical protein ACXYUI_27775, partial [Klebsiella pneumoniae]
MHGVSAVPVPQANVYLNDYWLGATDSSGRLYLEAKGAGTLTVIKHGFIDHTESVSMGAQTKLAVTLVRQMAYLRVDSKPSGAT